MSKGKYCSEEEEALNSYHLVVMPCVYTHFEDG